ncbi:MAG: ATP-binding cassette domain-containing protein [Clostridia bacterium]|nr:ATP-binding cassette domain-containing protein [Clostridia bacterium]
MEIYRIENLSFTYPNADCPALKDVTFTVERGELVTLCGGSGSGKTTLLRLLKSAIAPAGTVSGGIYYNGKPLSDTDERTQASSVGFVMQNPENQIVCDKVWHELAFGLESLGVKTPEIRARVAEMASFFDIGSWFHKNVTELSGGQKQLLNLASVMTLSPEVILLDEPTSRLDPIAAEQFLQVLNKIKQELGVTVILCEHRLESALPISDRVIVLENGRVSADCAPCDLAGAVGIDSPIYRAIPTPMRVFTALGADALPVTVRDGRIKLEEYASTHTLDDRLIPKPEKQKERESVLELDGVWYRYEKSSPDVLRGLSLKVRRGEHLAIVGGNGAGKSTALAIASRLYKPYRGQVRVLGVPIEKCKDLYNGVIGVLPQDVQTLFTHSTVKEDLYAMVSDMPKDEKNERVNEVARTCKLGMFLDRHPYDLSGGEAQRTALAMILLRSPQILLLDEPTKGCDAEFKEIFAEITKTLKSRGMTVVTVSHDIEFCAEYADRCAMLFDGIIVSEGHPREFFTDKSFYTTAANRMSRSLLPSAILADDIIRACGKEVPPKKKHEGGSPEPVSRADTAKSSPAMSVKRPLAPRDIIAWLFMLAVIPLTVYLGYTFLDDRKYYFISLMIILETLVPFFLLFEGRRPRAREIVVISVLCAIAVAGRAAFFMLPQFKPVIAVMIITGVCLGSETGFLAGAIVGFVSNFFFGQGPWAPWQMFAFGVIGFLAGFLAERGVLRRNKLMLCIYGGLSTLLIYGGIMNPASVVMWQPHPTREMIISAYAVGLPFDLIHAAATVFFLYIISDPMIEKIERVKVKYGFGTA